VKSTGAWTVGLVLVAGCSFPEPEVIEEVADTSEVETAIVDSTAKDSSADREDSDQPSDSTVETTSDTSSDATDTSVVTDSAIDSRIDSVVTDTTMTDTLLTDSAVTDSAVADTRVDAPEATMCIGSDPLCDCDGDGDKAKGKTGCGGSGGDCDDGDPRRNSKVTSFLPDVPVGHAGDWDCNGTVTKEYPEGINCASYLTLTTGCTQQGYKGTPACGTTATLVQCKAGPLTNCVDGTTTTITVKCK
jgi:hypothetical protein